MAKHINLEDAKGKFEFCTKDMLGSWLAAMLDSLPTINIVYCVECRYKYMEICPMYKLRKAGVLQPYDFCSHGERIDNE